VGAVGLCLLVPAAASATTSGWSVTPTPNVPAPTGFAGPGNAESCVPDGVCVAVGSYVSGSGIGKSLAERWNGQRWRIKVTPNPAAARVSALNGVSCASASRCVAVGDWFGSSGIQRPLAERWNGSAWALVPIPNPAAGRMNVLYAVACASADACEAVGNSVGPAFDSVPIAEHWDGRRWRLQSVPSPAGAGFSYLDGVECLSAQRCIAVGQSDNPALVERWNGRRWRIQPSPLPAGASFGGLTAVACTSSSACTAVGGSSVGPLVQRWNGTRWRATTAPMPSDAQFGYLNDVACRAGFACEAVGAYGDTSNESHSLADGTRGGAWTLRPTQDPPDASGNFLNAIACAKISGCIAVGFANGDQTPRMMAQHLATGSWHEARIANPTGAAESTLHGVSCPAVDRCIAVGSGGDAMSQRWDGHNWRLLPTASPSGSTGSELDGVSCLSMMSCVAVGGYQTPAGSFVSLAERWNDGRWSTLPVPTPTDKADSGLGGVSCTSSSFCMAGGSATNDPSGNGPTTPLAEMWDGHAWAITPTPHTPGAVQTFLGATSCTSKTACTTVGEQHFPDGSVAAIAERWDGTRWRIQSTPSPAGVSFASFGGVSCISARHCLAVGGSDNGTLAEVWNGTRWQIMQTPQPPGGGPGTGVGFTAVACSFASACTAVGFGFGFRGGSVFAERWDGHTWQLQPTPLLPGAHDIDPAAIACPSRTECVSVAGYEDDGPGSHTLAEVWHGPSTAAQSTATAPTSSPVRLGAAANCNPLLLRLANVQPCSLLRGARLFGRSSSMR
jgi:hypothetical protein